MTPYELLEDIKRNCQDNIHRTIEESNDLLAEISKDPQKFIDNFGLEIEEFADKNNVCPTCGTKLIEMVSKESSEYFGQPVQENIYTYKCDNCNFKK